MFAELNETLPVEPSPSPGPPPVRQAAQSRNMESVFPKMKTRALMGRRSSLTCEIQLSQYPGLDTVGRCHS